MKIRNWLESVVVTLEALLIIVILLMIAIVTYHVVDTSYHESGVYNLWRDLTK